MPVDVAAAHALSDAPAPTTFADASIPEKALLSRVELISIQNHAHIHSEEGTALVARITSSESGHIGDCARIWQKFNEAMAQYSKRSCAY